MDADRSEDAEMAAGPLQLLRLSQLPSELAVRQSQQAAQVTDPAQINLFAMQAASLPLLC